MGNVPYVDLAGAELLVDLRGLLDRKASTSAWPRRTGRFAKRCGVSTRLRPRRLAEAHQTVDDVLSKWRVSAAPA